MLDRARPSALALLLLVGGAPGCSQGDDPGASSTTAPAGAPSTTGAFPAPTEPSDLADSDRSGRSELADGRHFGFWRTFEIGDRMAFGEFDLAYFLTGDEAEAAAAAKGDTVENDYYVVNDNPKLRTLIVSGDAAVRVLAGEGGPGSVPSNVADFAVDRRTSSGFWVTITDGLVTGVEEQYVP